MAIGCLDRALPMCMWEEGEFKSHFHWVAQTGHAPWKLDSRACNFPFVDYIHLGQHALLSLRFLHLLF